MGRAHCLVGGELASRIGRTNCIIVLNKRAHEQKTVYIIEVASELLPPGYNGIKDVIVEGDHVRFKKDCDA